jgi:hypothetical protein
MISRVDKCGRAYAGYTPVSQDGRLPDHVGSSFLLGLLDVSK